jgi:hypothetical protein
VSFAAKSGENRGTKSYLVLGLLVMMGSVDTLLTPINGILFLLGCGMLSAVAVIDDIFFFFY